MQLGTRAGVVTRSKLGFYFNGMGVLRFTGNTTTEAAERAISVDAPKEQFYDPIL